MVPGKEIENNFGEVEVEVGVTDVIQVTVDDVIYTLCGKKEPNYVMRMMSTGDRLLADYTF